MSKLSLNRISRFNELNTGDENKKYYKKNDKILKFVQKKKKIEEGVKILKKTINDKKYATTLYVISYAKLLEVTDVKIK